MKKRAPRAVLYAATGHPYFKAAVSSACSLKKHCKDLSIVLFSDRIRAHPVFEKIYVLPKPRFDFADKISALMAFDAPLGIFFDADTRIIGDIRPLFELLTRFDVAIAHASWRYSLKQDSPQGKRKQLYNQNACPLPFCELNTGVIAFRNNRAWKRFLTEWDNEYRKQLLKTDYLPGNDQPAFRLALWKSALNVFVLPPEYNYRCDFPGFAGSRIMILHGRHAQIRRFSGIINKAVCARVFIPDTMNVIAARVC